MNQIEADNIMDFEQARYNMVEQQIRPWEVFNDDILDLFREVHREHFVPEGAQAQAFCDTNISIGHQQLMLQPKEEARIIQALNLNSWDVVLEIGTGTGFMTTLLAKLARQVYSVDIFPEFTKSAQDKLQALNIKNVDLESGDAARGWDTNTPFDAIVFTGSLYEVPSSYFEKLHDNGRLICPLGDEGNQCLTLFTKHQDKINKSTLFEMNTPHLIHCKAPEKFKF